MPSPFPGMDPYIEACGLWGDFHHLLISSIHAQLADAAPERYLVRTNERNYLVLVEEEKDKHAFLPDVSITAPRKSKRSKGAKGGAATAVQEVEDGATLRAFIAEEHREAFVEIFEATPEQRLVTSIEVLSPSNKRPGTDGRDIYLRKRQSCLLGDTHLVEIDLLRGGERMPMLDPWPDSPYVLMVARRWKRGRCKVWEGHFDKPLPKVPVPLLDPDPDLTLDLQPMINAVYKRSRYAQSIDYTKPLVPPLSPDQSAWLAGRLGERKRGKGRT